MKKTVLLIWLLFTCIITYSNSPEKLGKKPAGEMFSSPSPSNMNFYNDFIYPVRGLYFNVSPGITEIMNSNLASNFWDLNAGFGYNLSVGYFQSLSPWFRIMAGVGFSSIKSKLTVNGDAPVHPVFTDIDNDSYKETLTLTNVEKKANPMYFSVPFIFEFGNPNIDKVGFYTDLGIKYSFLINDSYQSSGTYATKGTYDQYKVTLENVPELGFYSGKELESNASFKKSNISLLAGVGIFIPLSSVVIFKGGLVTNIGLTDIGNGNIKNTNSDVISDEVYSYRAGYIDNSFAVVKGSKTFHLGIEFGVYVSRRLK